jgi:hypothetical protein
VLSDWKYLIFIGTALFYNKGSIYDVNEVQELMHSVFKFSIKVL